MVLEVPSNSEVSAASAPFASFAAERNLILLGEPGSGKTTLFKASVHGLSGVYLTVRSFLNRPVDSLRGFTCLFIDALDEKRAGRGDSNTVDLLVQKLIALQPDKVRLSCRVGDWLGETDLAALNDYFDAT